MGRASLILLCPWQSVEGSVLCSDPLLLAVQDCNGHVAMMFLDGSVQWLLPTLRPFHSLHIVFCDAPWASDLVIQMSSRSECSALTDTVHLCINWCPLRKVPLYLWLRTSPVKTYFLLKLHIVAYSHLTLFTKDCVMADLGCHTWKRGHFNWEIAFIMLYFFDCWLN